MSFVAEFATLPLGELLERSGHCGPVEVEASLGRSRRTLTDFAHLISPAAQPRLEALCQEAHALTVRRFGKVMRLFAPLYLSNECINSCRYCGFSRENPILRVTLTVDEVVRETRALIDQGFRNVLLVAGEHPRFVSPGYLRECIQAVHALVPSVSLEVGPMEVPDYVPLVAAGADGLVVYQETYDQDVYAHLHPAGPKRDFDWRLETPERAYAAGFRRLGIGALHGLADWRREAICVAAHASWLVKHCWKAFLTVSLPRLRPHAGPFQPLTQMSDRDLVQLTAALRLFLPDVGLVLSTREGARLRDGLVRVGITLMSAGSRTEPGGYTGAGQQNLHLTDRGRIRPWTGTDPAGATGPATGHPSPLHATVQFTIADDRPPREIAAMLERLGYEPVWKDWGCRPDPLSTSMETSTVTANGKPVEVRFPCSLETFLQSLQLVPRTVVVELNGQAVVPSEFAGQPLAPGDRLEIVRIVAGG